MADRLPVLDAGGVCYGLNAGRDAMSDVNTLAALIEGPLEEPVFTVSGR